VNVANAPLNPLLCGRTISLPATVITVTGKSVYRPERFILIHTEQKGRTARSESSAL
jgi:hypothetical protein